ncbi:Uncharacterized protein Adt_06698 [Abeliophyllum distichum]|uniref:Uncharacterized protein n=1 Tax=Abeliophyllum distichum TaxID=126358 RepID=A0ABD1V7Y2_9LAMI
MMSTTRYSILANWENFLNENVDEAIARRKNRGRLISLKEDLFTEELMSVPLPLKLKDPPGDFDGTTDPSITYEPSKTGEDTFNCVMLVTHFPVVRTPIDYNSIHFRSIINSVEAIISTQHLAMKFLTSREVGTVRRDQLISKRCYVDIMQTDPMVLPIEKDDSQQTYRFKLAEEVELVELEENKKIAIGRSLSKER